MRLFISALFILLFLTSSDAAVTTVTVHIQWEYKDFPAQAAIYGVKENARLWETRAVGTEKEAPVTEEVKDSTFQISPGEVKRFAMMVRNSGGKPLYFFAAPHQTAPPEDSLGSKIKCLCIGRAYTAGPGQVWYRVLEFRLARNYVGRELTIIHSIIGIDENRAKAFSKGSELPDF